MFHYFCLLHFINYFPAPPYNIPIPGIWSSSKALTAQAIEIPSPQPALPCPIFSRGLNPDQKDV